MDQIALATEDELSETVGLRLIARLGAGTHHPMTLRRGGNGYLRSSIGKFHELSKRIPVLLITDLDSIACPPELIRKWMGNSKPNPNMLFRIAVREVESWLLADHDAMGKLLGSKTRRPSIPHHTDQITDPKKLLLELAKRASREVREDLLAEKNAIASQGLGYNRRLCAFVKMDWDPDRAATRSESLRRACYAIRRWNQQQ